MRTVKHRLPKVRETAPSQIAKLFALAANLDRKWLDAENQADKLDKCFKEARALADSANEKQRAATNALINAPVKTLADAVLKARYVCELIWAEDEPEEMLGDTTDMRMIASLLRDLMTLAREGGAA